jgi:hypothetical protein
MGFGIRVMPGVRVRVSSRGAGVSVGPRIARVHVGTGRVGISSGIGPVTFSTGVGGGRRGGGGGGATGGGSSSGGAVRYTHPSGIRYNTAQATMTLAQAQKVQSAADLKKALDTILALHRQSFPAAQRPLPLAPPPLDVGPLAQARRQAIPPRLSGRERRVARIAADLAAHEDAAALAEEGWDEFERAAHAADEWWAALVSNVPAHVTAALDSAFDDNDAAAAVLSVDGDEVSLVVLVPHLVDVPERSPGRTASGNLTLRKLPQRERNDLYASMICGYLLVTVREAFAVAPGARRVRIVAIRDDVDAYGRQTAQAVAAATFDRARLEGVRWDDATSVRIVDDVADEQMLLRQGTHQTIEPIDLAREPEIAVLVSSVDFAALTADEGAEQGARSSLAVELEDARVGARIVHERRSVGHVILGGSSSTTAQSKVAPDRWVDPSGLERTSAELATWLSTQHQYGDGTMTTSRYHLQHPAGTVDI